MDGWLPFLSGNKRFCAFVLLRVPRETCPCSISVGGALGSRADTAQYITQSKSSETPESRYEEIKDCKKYHRDVSGT